MCNLQQANKIFIWILSICFENICRPRLRIIAFRLAISRQPEISGVSRTATPTLDIGGMVAARGILVSLQHDHG